MFEMTSYIDDQTGEQKIDIRIHREDDACFQVELEDINGNVVNSLGDDRIEMCIYDKERYYHPLIVIPMDKQTMEIYLSQKETRQLYFDRDYYYKLIYVTETGLRTTFITGSITLINSGGSDEYGCCDDQIVQRCKFTRRTQWW